MNHNIKFSSHSIKAFALTGVITGCLLMFSGCRSLNSTFGSGANDGAQLPKLAFWKKGVEASPPPPPAHHLDPSSTQPLGQLAQNAGSAVGDIDNSINNITNAARNHADKLAAAGASRTPYQVEDAGIGKAADALKSNFKVGQNELSQGLAQATNKLKSSATAITGSGSSTRAALGNQLASAKKEIDNSFKSAADLRGASNDIKATLARKNAQLKSGIESAIQNKPFDASLAKVNKSLYDMKGNLVSGSKKSFNGTTEDARQRFSAALGSLDNRAAVAANRSTNFGSELKNKLASTASTLKQPLRSTGETLKSAIAKSTDPVADQAQGLLQKAKQRVAGLGTGFDFPEPQTKPAPPTRLTNRQLKSVPNSGTTLGGGTFGGGTFGGGSTSKPAVAAQQKPFSGSEFGRTRVANVTPASSGTTGAVGATSSSAGLASSLTNAWNNGARQSKLKPIEVNGVGSTPGNVLRTASLQSSDFGSSAAIPRFGNAKNVTVGHVSDIDIPQKVLSGSGSYAPGSVNKVR